MEEEYIISYVTNSGQWYPSHRQMAEKMSCPSAVDGKSSYETKRKVMDEVEFEKIPVKVFKKAYNKNDRATIFLIQDTKYNEYYLIGRDGLKLYSNQIEAIPSIDF